MGRSLPSTASKLQELARLVSSSSPPERLQKARPRHTKPPPPLVLRVQLEAKTKQIGRGSRVRVDTAEPVRKAKMDINWEGRGQERVPLAQVVSECVQRWFQDTLKAANNGDTTMEVLVGQMYMSGYGVPRDEQKGRAWISRASKCRSSAWKVSDKPPGYAASDSDSDEGDTK